MYFANITRTSDIAIYNGFRSARQSAILDAVGPFGRRAQALFAVGFVFRPVAIKENNLAVAFKGQDMGGNAVQEPAVVADHHGAAAEIFQGFFQRSQGVDVQVVGGLVQEDDVGPFLKHLGEVHPVALSAGKGFNFLLLVGAG